LDLIEISVPAGHAELVIAVNGRAGCGQFRGQHAGRTSDQRYLDFVIEPTADIGKKFEKKPSVERMLLAHIISIRFFTTQNHDSRFRLAIAEQLTADVSCEAGQRVPPDARRKGWIAGRKAASTVHGRSVAKNFA